jgi:hypothetical protein
LLELTFEDPRVCKYSPVQSNVMCSSYILAMKFSRSSITISASYTRQRPAALPTKNPVLVLNSIEVRRKDPQIAHTIKHKLIKLESKEKDYSLFLNFENRHIA